MNRAPEAPPPARSFALSFAVHAGLLALALLLPRMLGMLSFSPPPPMEIEITSPFLGDGPAKLGAPKPFTPGVPAKINSTAETPPVPTPLPPKAPEKAPEPPKDWVLPGPSTKVLEAPPPGLPPSAHRSTQTRPAATASPRRRQSGSGRGHRPRGPSTPV